MKSDGWILKKIIEEFFRKSDVAFIREEIEKGRSDEEIAAKIHERMAKNGKGMRAYIGNEKIKAIALKIAYKVHWVFIHAVIKEWLHILEVMVRWKEDRHGEKIQRKAMEIKEALVEAGDKLKRDPHDENAREEVISALEKAAEEVIEEIVKEVRTNDKESRPGVSGNRHGSGGGE